MNEWSDDKTDDWSASAYLLKGFVILIAGVGGFLAWSMLVEVEGAVVAPGHVEVEARRQVLQHPDGGRVNSISVREGGQVKVGDEILRLDDAQLKAQKALLQRQLYEIWAKIDRFSAERRREAQVTYRDELRKAALVDPEVAAVLAEETLLFNDRRDTLQQTYAQSRERIRQTQAAIEGREGQLTAGEGQLKSIQTDVARQAHLLERGFGRSAAVAEFDRERLRLEGENRELQAGIAEARSAIAGYELEQSRFEANWRETSQRDLRALQPEEAGLRERLRLIETQLERLVLRAPMSGTILSLRVHTIGGVIAPGSEAATIVPDDTPLIFSVEVPIADRDRVQVGLPATVVFPTFNARTTPRIEGRVGKVGADALADPNTGRRFYTAELTITEDGRRAMQGQELMPGMPVEAFIRTDARSPASFLIKPVTDYFSHAMREE